MNDADERETKHECNRKQRRAFVKQWAEFVRTQPDEIWGEQVKTLIDSQVETAQALEDIRVDPDRVRNSPLLSDDE